MAREGMCIVPNFVKRESGSILRAKSAGKFFA